MNEKHRFQLTPPPDSLLVFEKQRLIFRPKNQVVQANTYRVDHQYLQQQQQLG